MHEIVSNFYRRGFHINPVFRKAAAAAAAEPRVHEILTPIDELYHHGVADAQARARISRCLDELGAAVNGMREHLAPRLAQCLLDTLAASHALICEELQFRQRQMHMTIPAGTRAAARQVGEALAKHGLWMTRLDPTELAHVRQLAADAVDVVRARKRQARNAGMSHMVHAEGPGTRLFAAATGMLRSAGIEAGVCHFQTRRVAPIYVAVQVSDDDETWWQGCYAEHDMSTSPTSYLHLDRDLATQKCIFYLSDVAKENGPFAYVPGSHTWPYSRAWSAFFKSLDVAVAKAYAVPMSDRDFYYRRQFRHPEFLPDFGRLPADLQGTSHFGDDIPAGTPESQFLLQAERHLTSDVADCFVFDGAQVIHRGGMVERGSRIAVQVAYAKQPQSYFKHVRHWKNWLASKLKIRTRIRQWLARHETR